MGVSIEIIPSKKLDENWQQKICSQNLDNELLNLKMIGNDYFLIYNNDELLFHVWLSEKDTEVFADLSYLEGLKNIDAIDVESFIYKFKEIPYTLILESKAPRSENSLSQMINAAKILGSITNGIIVFDHDVFGFDINYVYLANDLPLL